MTNLEYVELQKFLNERVKDYSLRKKTISIALGVALSRWHPIPTSTVEFPQEHFSFNVLGGVNQEIASFNELITIDFDLVSEVARSFWLIRYYAANPPVSIPLITDSSAGFMDKVSGAAHFVNPEILAFCEQTPELLIVMVNKINKILRKE